MLLIPLAVLLVASAIGTGIPVFLFPDFPDAHMDVIRLAVWVGATLTVFSSISFLSAGSRRHLLAGSGILAATSLGASALLWLNVRNGTGFLPVLNLLGRLMGLDGESSVDAAMFELWLEYWILLALPLLLLGAVARHWRTRRLPS